MYPFGEGPHAAQVSAGGFTGSPHMLGDVRKKFEMQLAPEVRSELRAEPRQARPHPRRDLFHPRAEAFDLEDPEIVLSESK